MSATITPHMLAAANRAHNEWIDLGRTASLRSLYTMIYQSMEECRVSQEEAVRRDRMMARGR